MVLLSKVTEDQITENLRKRYTQILAPRTRLTFTLLRRINADLMFTYIGPTLVAGMLEY